MKTFSVVVPAYNEEKHIEDVLVKLKKKKWIDEILVVNDGSKDNTQKIAEKQAKVLSYGRNMGKGYAMKYGAEKARSDYVIFFEGDDQLDVNDLEKMREKLLSGCDMVVGKRDFNVIPWPRKTNNALTSFALFLATGKFIKDPLSGFIGVDRKKFNALKLKENRFNIESEICCSVARKGMKKAYIDENVKYHVKKAFHFNKLSWKQSFFIVVFLIKKVLRYED